MRKQSGISRIILFTTTLVVIVLTSLMVFVMTYFMRSLTDTILLQTLRPMAKTAIAKGRRNPPLPGVRGRPRAPRCEALRASPVGS